MKPVIALIGRPNVGKSTLFNRLTKTKNALVADMPGLTRDRQYGFANLAKKSYILVDTGGFEPLVEDGVMYQMARQSQLAIAESDAVLFVVDGRNGITPQDQEIANQIRRFDKPVYVLVNKVEGLDNATAISDFYALGLDNLYPISATHGEGVNTAIEALLKHFDYSESETTEAHNGQIKFAVIGRPNVGKSTLTNAILGQERVITFDEAGTTRDSILIEFEKDGKSYAIIDTAGIRRKGKVYDKIEKFSVLKAIAAIEDSHVVVLVLDAHLDIAGQDATIVGYAMDRGKSIVVAINKWDSLDNETRTQIKADIKRKFHFLDYVRFNYISALNHKGIDLLLDSINEAYQSAFAKLSTPKLTKVLLEALRRQPPSYKGNFRPKLRYAHQGGSNPPTIIIHGNSVESVADSYTRYLERCFRKVFNLIGTTLRIEYKSGDNPYDKTK